MDTAHKISVVNKYMEAVTTGSMDLIKEIYADNATVEDPVGTPRHEGIDAVCGFYQQVLGMNVKLELMGDVRCAGNAAAFPFSATIGDTRIEVIDIFEFNDEGKVTSMKAYWGPENRS